MISEFENSSAGAKPSKLTPDKILAMLEGMMSSPIVVAIGANPVAIPLLEKNIGEIYPKSNILSFPPEIICDPRLPIDQTVLVYTHEALVQYVNDIAEGKPWP